jgi:hypothetical protein
LFTGEDILGAPVVNISITVKALHDEMGNQLGGERIFATLGRGFPLEHLEQALLKAVKLGPGGGNVQVKVNDTLEETTILYPL